MRDPWPSLVVLATWIALPVQGEHPQATPLRVFQFDGGRIVEIRRQIDRGDPRLADAPKLLRARADRELRTPMRSVVEKPQTPPSGDKHDYLSLAPYFWPDPDQPDGKPYIRRDGRTNPERDRYDAPTLGRLCRAVPTLALAYALTGHEPYAGHAARLLRAWFLDPQTRMNPNLEFGQFVPGRSAGRAMGIIETRGLIGVADAVGLLEGSDSWTTRDTEGMRAWFRDYLAWLRQSKLGQDEARARNNHGTWYDAQAATYALFVGEDRLARDILEASRGLRIAQQIEPDGRQPHELGRTKSLDYCLFNLEALVTLATLGERVGVDLWHDRTPYGRSLRRALDWLITYATGARPWPHEQITRPKAGKLLPLLRRAATVYQEPGYKRVFETLINRGERPDEVQELLWPPGPAG